MSRTFVSSSLRAVAQASRIVAPQAARRVPLLANAARSFSSSIIRANQTSAALLDVVKSEYKIANSIDNELAPDHVQYLNDSGFEVIHKNGESNVQLAKTLESGEKLTVFFDIDEVTDVSFGSPEAPEEEDAASEEQLEDELYQYDSTFANVKVLVSNEANNNGLFFNLMLQSSEEEFFVDYFNYKPDVAAFLKQVEDKGTFLGNFEYQGPRFSNLDESLQASVEKYLNEKGIDSGLADFIFGYSEVKEEESYRDLLKDVSNYLKQN
ncbi:hypothetical protein CJI97_004227 [Candidozyma auris]|nr:hypothetical protein CJI97_004227 [[Candida] auris]